MKTYATWDLGDRGISVLMLDFDGVVNSRAYWDRYQAGEIAKLPDFAHAIDPEAVRRLNRVLVATGASVVVSRSWRHGRTVAQRQAILAARGFQGTVSDVTPDFRGAPRGQEIRAWMCSKRVYPREIAILDDDGDMGDLTPRLVRTDPAVGLTDADALKAVAMLNELRDERLRAGR